MDQFHRVLYDFAAEDAGELSVNAGQIVIVKEEGAGNNAGWSLIQTTGESPSTGYVPSDYLQLVTDAVRSPSDNVRSPYGNQFVSPSAAFASASSVPGTSRVGQDAVPPTPSTNFGASQSLSSTWATSAADEFAQLFSSHEEWFRAASSKRKEVYNQLLREANEVSDALKHAESLSTNVLNRIHELDNVITEEKNKWQPRVIDEVK